MMRFIRDLRLIPIVLIASVCLLALKTADLLLDRGYLATADNAPAGDDAASVVRTMPDVPPATPAQHSWAQQMFNFPNASGAAPPSGGPAPAAIAAIVPPAPPATAPAPAPADKGNADITGSVPMSGGESGAAPAKAEAGGAPGKTGNGGNGGKDGKSGENIKLANGTLVAADGALLPSGAERAILERLQERRQQLETRARELDIREGLIQAAEKRMEARLAELKEVEAHIAAATGAKDGAEAARFKGLVTMYENMKPRDAAKIFDRLELGVLIEVASQINPRRMSDILAQMSPDTAERLTVELASRARLVDKDGAELPKIEGRPTTP